MRSACRSRSGAGQGCAGGVCHGGVCAGSAGGGEGQPGGCGQRAGCCRFGRAGARHTRPFAEVIKDAKQIEGLLTLWQKDDKVWIELRPADLNQPFFLSPKVKSGIGERVFVGGLMSSENSSSSAASTTSCSCGAQHRLHRPGRARPRRARSTRRFRRACWPERRCEPAAPGAQVGAGRGQRPVPQRHARPRQGLQRSSARATRSTPATRQSPRAQHARRGGARGAEPFRRRLDRACRSRVRRPARRCPPCRARCPTRAACS